MTRTAFMALAAATLLSAAPGVTPTVRAADDVEVTLRGSRASMIRQNGIAKSEAFSFLRTPTQVRKYVEGGHLVPLGGNDDYRVIAGYPFARPVVQVMIERLAAEYRAACGEQLVVTSLTRPLTRQPSNASPLSVHPAGMAVDLRYSANPTCRRWLMDELLRLEDLGVLDATLEMRPPHFHVAVFPTPYITHELRLAADSIAAESVRLLEEAVAARDAAIVDEDAVSDSADAESTRLPTLLRVATFLARLMLPLPV
jgi:hypothetical protein